MCFLRSQQWLTPDVWGVGAKKKKKKKKIKRWGSSTQKLWRISSKEKGLHYFVCWIPTSGSQWPWPLTFYLESMWILVPKKFPQEKLLSYCVRTDEKTNRWILRRHKKIWYNRLYSRVILQSTATWSWWCQLTDINGKETLSYNNDNKVWHR